MKIVFFTNFLTHHQLPFCEEMYKIYGDDFVFVSTEKINEERLSLGYEDMDSKYPFVLKSYESKEKLDEALALAKTCDVAIFGSTTSDMYAKERLKEDKLSFRYYARMFYKGPFSIFDFQNLKKVRNRHFKYKKNKNLYLLCSSSFAPNDFNKFGMYKNKCYKWGYFPEFKEYDVDDLLSKKEENQILWVGRFINQKHPEHVVKLAKKLKQDGYKFKIKMIGNGVLFDRTKKQIEENNLQNEIELVGALNSNKVRDYMEKAPIFICTSNKEERWAVVINEAMNSGCAVVAYKYIGAVPFLIGDKNGISYTSFNGLYKNVKDLLDNKEEAKKLGKKAYEEILNNWTAKVAANNFGKMIESIIKNKENEVKEGAGSIAEPVK